MRAVHGAVQRLQEVDGLQVLAPAVAVGHPLAVVARVVEVEHRRHGVHAQAVEVVLVEPEQPRRHEEAAHLGPAVVEDAGVPLRMKALARIGVLVQVRAVEVPEPVLVGWKVRRHPVEQHADALLVQVIDEVHEVLRRTETRGGREVAGGLVAPRAVERVLGHGHELHVREAHLVHVGGQPVRDFAVAEKLAVLALPRAQVHLVDRLRRIERVALAARRHPFVVAPGVGQVADARGGGRRWLRAERDGVGLVDRVVAVVRTDAVLVGVACRGSRCVPVPDARAVRARRERIGVARPAVPVADHRDRRGVGCPHRETCTALFLVEVAAEQVVQPGVGSFPKKVDVAFALAGMVRCRWHRRSR
ncbi:hypothetical protein D9M72_361740 [compost metagenome]